ncbi:MAG TPA: c-type cytochrome domain-containing protein [Labilithrix sp.]|jgi:hypothetical protein|nr:c-type cytochrome domain-containing protein [Labilithrix sp.]
MSRFFSGTLVLSGVVSLLLVGMACGTDDGGGDGAQCVAAPLDCQPIVAPPTFDAIYTNVLQPSCASGAGRCHGSAAAAGLDMRAADSAFAGLSKRVNPDSVGCSLVLRRVESSSSSFRMPPGPTPLSEPQRCAIRQWIANGAQR